MKYWAICQYSSLGIRLPNQKMQGYNINLLRHARGALIMRSRVERIRQEIELDFISSKQLKLNLDCVIGDSKK